MINNEYLDPLVILREISGEGARSQEASASESLWSESGGLRRHSKQLPREHDLYERICNRMNREKEKLQKWPNSSVDRYYKMVVPIVFAPLYLGSNFGISGMESDLECGTMAERVYKRIGSGRECFCNQCWKRKEKCGWNDCWVVVKWEGNKIGIVRKSILKVDNCTLDPSCLGRRIGF